MTVRIVFLLLTLAQFISFSPDACDNLKGQEAEIYQNNLTDVSVSCRLESEPVVIRDEESVRLQYWIEKKSERFERPVLPRSPSLDQFRADIDEWMDSDYRSILEQQRHQVEGGDAYNVELALSGEAGSIREMNCLEGLLLSVQTDRMAAGGSSMFQTPTEFMSYVLERDDEYKIYFFTVDQPGIGGLGPLNALLSEDRDEGWRVTVNLHNHNFFPELERVLGGVVPSATDIGFYRSAAEAYGLERALITNGFHTIELTRDEFQLFSNGEDR